jgi:hypothetical protein
MSSDQHLKKWEKVFTFDGHNGYTMEQWKPAFKFHFNPSYDDPNAFMRMRMAIDERASIAEAFGDLVIDRQVPKKTRSGAFFGLNKDDMAVRDLKLYLGWPDFWNTTYNFNWEAAKSYNFKEALWRQKQIGGLIGQCTDLERLHLENIEMYHFTDKNDQSSVALFFRNLQSCTKLRKLAVVNNVYGADFMADMIPVLVTLPLRELDLRGNRLSRGEPGSSKEDDYALETAFLEALAKLGQCKTLTSLSLADINLRFYTPDDQTTRCVIRLMQELPLLTTLDLGENKTKPEGRAAIEDGKPSTLQVMF